MRKKLCLIPARGGSKRLPRKNILPLAGKPLLAYTIDTAIDAKVFDEIIVTSDDPEILKIAKKFGAIALKRENELSGDKATVFQVFKQFLLKGGNREKYDSITAMLPTCPFKTAEQVREAFGLYLRHKGDASIISVTAFDYPPQLGFRLEEDGTRLAMSHPEVFAETTRSQNIPTIYHNNGAIWISSVENYLKHGTFYKGKMVAFIMDAITSFDIDYPWQFEIARILAEKTQRK